MGAEAPDCVCSCTFMTSRILLIHSAYDNSWKLTLFLKNFGSIINSSLDNEFCSMLNNNNCSITCGSMYGAVGVVDEEGEVPKTHYRTFKYDKNEGILQILGQVVLEGTHTFVGVFDQILGALWTNKQVLTTYMILKSGSLIEKSQHNLPFPITSFLLCPHSWIVTTKQTNCSDCVMGLIKLSSKEQTVLPFVISESIDSFNSLDNVYTFNVRNTMHNDEDLIVTISFPSTDLYTISTAQNYGLQERNSSLNVMAEEIDNEVGTNIPIFTAFQGLG
ncbi:hypothetical protein PCE1_000147 [Barthelona sp. PCE]